LLGYFTQQHSNNDNSFLHPDPVPILIIKRYGGCSR